MQRDFISDDARDSGVDERQPRRTRKYLGDLAVLACCLLFVLLALAVRLHSIWLH